MSNRPTVLAVDDDAEVRALLCDVLEDAGYAVTSACDGREALIVLATQPPPAVVLLDLKMPVMDGWDVLKAIRADPSLASIPVIAASVYTSRGAPGADRLLRKPFSLDDLLGAVEAYCRP